MQIWFSNIYPFHQPLIKIRPNKDLLCYQDCTDYQQIDFYCNKTYSVKMTIIDIIKIVQEYCKEHLKYMPDEARQNSLLRILHQTTVKGIVEQFFALLIAVSLLLRVMCGLGSHSGMHDPPNFGDFEAHRHWMELTTNLPVHEWYVKTPQNDLSYWRIDYPPLMAYISYFFGLILQLVDDRTISLYTSRGFESPTLKLYMRITVLVSELVFFYSSYILLVLLDFKRYSRPIRYLVLFAGLVAPPLILIDHGHFQYNCLALGFTVWTIYLFARRSIMLGSAAFVMALNVK